MTDEALLQRIKDQLVTENEEPELNVLDTLVDLFVNDTIAYNQLLDEVAAIGLDIKRGLAVE